MQMFWNLTAIASPVRHYLYSHARAIEPAFRICGGKSVANTQPPQRSLGNGTKGGVTRFPIGRCEGTLGSAPFQGWLN